MPGYGAVTSRLPWMARPDAEASLASAAFVGRVGSREGGWQRTTTAGTIVIDAVTHRGALEKRSAHSAPARERRGALGPSKRPSRGPGQSPGLDKRQPL